MAQNLASLRTSNFQGICVWKRVILARSRRAVLWLNVEMWICVSGLESKFFLFPDL